MLDKISEAIALFAFAVAVSFLMYFAYHIPEMF